MRRVAKGFALLLATLAVTAGVGLAAFVANVGRANGPVPNADGIVALTGGADRVETALRLLDAGKARMLLVSGVAHGAGLHDLARRVALDPALLASRVTLGRTATTTFGNAEEAAEWARDHELHTLIIVTASYHMPRAMLEMRRAMPGATLYALAVEPQAMREASRIRLLLGEYAKFVAAWLGLSHIVQHQVALVHGKPGDNSVDG